MRSRAGFKALLSLVGVFCLLSAATHAQPLPNIDYAKGDRSHPFDILHLKLDIDLDFDQEIVSGSVTHSVRWLNPAYDEMELDAAEGITIESVSSDARTLDFRRDSGSVSIMLGSTPSYGDTLDVVIQYSAKPTSGLWFVKKEEDEPHGRDQIWTQGEGEEHHHWIPMYDYPNDLATTEVIARVRSDWKLLSNGQLVDVENIGRKKKWHYRLDKPHAPYLITIAAGDYMITRDTAAGVPLEYWTYPDLPEQVEPSFESTPDVVRFCADLFDTPYPWGSYAQVVIDEFMYGGMENTGATTLNDFALVDRNEKLDYDPSGLIAHEYAHQWFGDLVTNRSWDHLWIHESFATFIAARYALHADGIDDYQKKLRDYRHGAYSTDREKGPSAIAGGEGHTANIYGRGAYVLHMLSIVVGDDLFWRSINHFLEKHQYSVVETNDLKIAFAETTGLNLDWFFDAWIYGVSYPELYVERRDEGDSIRFLFTQMAADSSDKVFRFPIDILTYEPNASGRSGSKTHRLWITDSTASLAVAARNPAATIAVIDPGERLLGNIIQSQSIDALLAQARTAPRAVDRLDAVKDLQSRLMEIDSVARADSLKYIDPELAEMWQDEDVTYVQNALVELGAIVGATDIEDLVIASLKSEKRDARWVGVENSWVLDSSRRIAHLRPLLDDPSSTVAARALKMMATTGAEGLEGTVARLRYVKGARERTARDWMEAVAAGEFAREVDRVAWYAMQGSRPQTRAAALETLTALGRIDSVVVNAVRSGLADNRGQVVNAALNVCVRLQDPALINVLRQARDGADDDLRTKIDETLEEIRAGNSSNDNE